jgi:ATP-dependent DNA helicase RecQ
VPRRDRKGQVLEVVQRHPGQAVIVYCISRQDTERIADHLRRKGVRAAHYHAGMQPTERRATQDDFTNERIDVIVATVAFGMGIDRSDVRCVIHAAMPKSLEHYQQETGRAGRDGLEAECVLLYSAADVMRWKSLIEKSAAEAGKPTEVIEAATGLLEQMRKFCLPSRCRHKSLSQYFGQQYDQETCQACDVCLQEGSPAEDGTVIAQKILSCVARVEQRFGIGHVVDVLRGADTERMTMLRHFQLSTYGLMKDTDQKSLTNLVYQLIDQDLLARTDDEFPVLELNEASWQVLKGERQVRIIPPKPKTRSVQKTGSDQASWIGVDRALFDSLRGLRSGIAKRRNVPPYVIFNDASLRDMARRRPSTPSDFLATPGVGEKKLADFGATFMAHLEAYRPEGDPPSQEPIQ